MLQDKMDAGVAVEDISHESVEQLSRVFRGSHLLCATVDEEGFATVSTFQRRKYP